MLNWLKYRKGVSVCNIIPTWIHRELEIYPKQMKNIYGPELKEINIIITCIYSYRCDNWYFECL